MHLRNGFTLIELLVVIAIIAVIASFGIPEFRTMVENGRITSETNGLHGLMQLARSEAATSKVLTRICGSTDQASCDTDSWEQGVIVFRDNDRNGSAAVAELVKVMQPITSGNTIRGLIGALSFNTDGTLNATPMLIICDSRGVNSSRQVRLNTAGQSRITRGNAQGDVVCP
jgi:type IV fimbrial biogenesis protein FimT